MKTKALFLMAVAIGFLAACSKSSPEAASAPSQSGAMQADYKKICQHLVPLAAVEKRDSFAASCEASYRSYLPSCSNAAAVTDCFANIKSWDERLACLDSCKRDTPPAR